MQHPYITAEYLFAPKDNSFEEQVQICFNRLSAEIGGVAEIVKITVFTHCTGNGDYSEKLRLLKEAGSKYPPIKCPITLVSQPLADKQEVAVEVWRLDSAGHTIDFKQKKFTGGESLSINSKDFSALFVTCQYDGGRDFDENVSGVFSILEKILVSQGFDFSNVVRQWNYIENITNLDSLSGVRQNYQVFNDFRSSFYQKTLWPEGYPAATGIGMDTGGVAIEAIAVKFRDEATVKAIASPVQTDAFNYSSNVLVGVPIREVPQTTSPKFARAKYVDSFLGKIIFVSGTASIIGEKTEYAGDAGPQTRLTIENIHRLVTAENLYKAGVNDFNSLKLLNYRVYIKQPEDFSIIQKVCHEAFGNAPGLFVRADVCRNDLLVEIEANYTASSSG